VIVCNRLNAWCRTVLFYKIVFETQIVSDLESSIGAARIRRERTKENATLLWGLWRSQNLEAVTGPNPTPLLQTSREKPRFCRDRNLPEPCSPSLAASAPGNGEASCRS
jgi:hypothetical protein